VPSDSEWEQLIGYLGGKNTAGTKMKSKSLWVDCTEKGKGNNSSGLACLPAGYRDIDRGFDFLGQEGAWWSASAAGEGLAGSLGLNPCDSEVSRYSIDAPEGYSIRLVKDFSPPSNPNNIEPNSRSVNPFKQISENSESGLPCSGSIFLTRGKYFRVSSNGEGPDKNESKKIAVANAKTEMEEGLIFTFNAIAKKYVNLKGDLQKEEILLLETLNREIANQLLSGVRTLCEKSTKTNLQTYKTYLAIELSSDKLLLRFDSQLSNHEQLKANYDSQKFQEAFNYEMEQLMQE
jgi:hypothetical protein